MSHLLVIGSLNMDLIAQAPRLPQPGETIIGATFSMAAGGKGANQAVAAARLGAAVHMIGRIGDDHFGHQVRSELAFAGVAVEHVRIDSDCPTATGHIVLDRDGRNAIVVASGANAHVSAAQIRDAGNAWQGAGAVVLQLEIPIAANLAAVAVARERGLPIVLNAAPMDLDARELVEAVDYLVVNEIEAEQLAGERIATPEDAIDLAHAIARPRQTVVITIGAQGAVLVGETLRAHEPAPRVEVVDTTAAGDAFVGGFAAELLRGAPPDAALRTGVLAGSAACTKLGAIPSLPTRAELLGATRQRS